MCELLLVNSTSEVCDSGANKSTTWEWSDAKLLVDVVNVDSSFLTSLSKRSSHGTLQSAAGRGRRRGRKRGQGLEDIKVTNEEDDRAAVGEVGDVVPPVDEPAAPVLVGAPCLQPPLQLLALASHCKGRDRLQRATGCERVLSQVVRGGAGVRGGQERGVLWVPG